MHNVNQELDPADVQFPLMAAVFTSGTNEADEMIDSLVTEMLKNGERIVGCLQRVTQDCSQGCGLNLQSISTGELHKVTQQLGAGSVSCNIDSEAIEQLSMKLLLELNQDMDLVIINRYGKRESEGAGFRCVIERAIEMDIPVLTVVNEKWVDDWLSYGGEWATVLPPDRSSLLRWYEGLISSAF